ncbi:MAG: DNA polymerase III subunit gamma/tau [Candidatus Kapaibacterium sp.]
MSESKEFLVTARKWRPRLYSDVVGQGHITKTLKNSISSDRVHHAYLFSGPRGVGKTTTARIHAIALNNHTDDYEPDLNSELAKQLGEGRAMDIIEIDGASNNSVDDVRRLRENAKYPPVNGKYKVYIIDEVHMLSDSAFNALLKIIEEPPPHLVFILATTEPQKIPATILSRCQRYNFRRMEIEEIVEQLSMIADAEGLVIDEESLQIIARKGDGSMRDSQSIFDQAIAFCGRDIKYTELASALNLIDEMFYFRISAAIINHDIKEIFAISNEIVTHGYDVKECMSGLLEHFRNTLTVVTTTKTDLIKTSKAFKAKYVELAHNMAKADLLRLMELASRTENDLRFASSPSIKFETALVQMASMDKAKDIESLLKEVMKLNGTELPTNPEPEKKKLDRLVEESPVEYKAEVKQEKVTEKPIEKPQEVVEEIPPLQMEEGLQDKWNRFVTHESLSGTDIAMVKEVTDVEFGNERIILTTHVQFIYENLGSHIWHLQSEFTDITGSKAKIELVKVVKEEEIVEEREKHPIEKKIISEFKAFEEKSLD